MKQLIVGLWLIGVFLVSALAGHTANPTIEAVLREMQRAEAAREAAVRDMVYTAETRVIEWEDASRQTSKSETLSVRKVYMREPDQMRNEYLSMAIDGRPLSEAEMRRELAKQRRGGGRGQGGGGQFVSPFSPEAAADYTFRLLGEGDYEGQPAWRIA